MPQRAQTLNIQATDQLMHLGKSQPTGKWILSRGVLWNVMGVCNPLRTLTGVDHCKNKHEN